MKNNVTSIVRLLFTLLLIMCFSNSFSQALPELMYYKFNSPGTTVQNEAQTPVGNNPATITGTGVTIGGTGLAGTALVGTGTTTSYVSNGWLTNLNSSFTIAFWTTNILQSTTLYYLFGDAGASSFRCFSGGVAGSGNWMMRGNGLPDITITGAASLSPVMTHIVYDSVAGQLTGYVNGVLTTTVTVTSKTPATGTGFQVGSYSTNNCVNGTLDEFRIYNRALNQAEITATYNTELFGAQFDAAVTQLITPNNNASCTLGSAEQVSIKVQNYGQNSISNFLVYYRVNGGTPSAGLVTTPIAPGASSTFAFPSTANLSATGSYLIEAWSALANDTIKINDTTKTTVYNYGGKITVNIRTDASPSQTTWKLLDGQTSAVIAQGGPYTTASTLYTQDICVDPNACIDFKIFDSGNNGLSAGSYFTVKYNGALIDSGGVFTSTDVTPDVTGACPDNSDAAVTEVYAYGKIPKNFIPNVTLGAYVRNLGLTNLSNIPVKLTNAGVNVIADTQLVSLNKGDSLKVNFDPIVTSNNGIDNITVSVPADFNNGNNSLSRTMEITDNQFAYADNSPVTRSIGFGATKGMLLCKYSSPESKFVTNVFVYIAGDALGKEVYAVVLNSAGTILANSAPKVIGVADTATVVSFPMATYPLIPSADFFVGLALPDTGFYPVGSQTEFPTRTGAYYAVFNIVGGSAPQDIGTQNLGRLAIGCTLGKAMVAKINATAGCKDNSNLVGLEMKNFSAIASFSFTVEFDTSKLTYTGLQNINAGLPNILANKVGKQVRISWVAPQGTPIVPVSIADGKIFDMAFTAKAAGSAIFKWDVTTQGANEISSLGGIGIGATYTGDTLIIQNCGLFAGSLVYDNTEVNPPIANKPLANVNIQLLPGDYAGLTNASGIFNLGDVPVGNYAIQYTNTKPWGGGNALDGLVILKHFVAIAPLSGVKLKAADCNGDNAVNSQDALLVSNRFVGIINKFQKIEIIGPGDTVRTTLSDWVYKYDNINLTGDTTFNITSVCRGDANGTYTSFTKATPEVELVKQGVMSLSSGIAEIPVRVTRPMSLGAVSLVIDAPASAEILDATFGTSEGTFIYNVIEKRQLRISWYSLVPAAFNTGDILLTIRARISNLAGLDFAISGNSLLASADAIVYKDAKLSIPNLVEESSAAGFGLVNYPNPFTHSTTISFELPEAGQVSLKVYDLLGKEVAALMNTNLAAGQHSLEFQPNDLHNGVYILKIRHMDNEASSLMYFNE